MRLLHQAALVGAILGAGAGVLHAAPEAPAATARPATASPVASGPASASPAAARKIPAPLADFLAFAHPKKDGCAGASDIAMLESPEGIWRARYRSGCGSRPAVEGLFHTRRRADGAVEIFGGFESAPGAIEAITRAAARKAGAGRAVELPIVQPEQTSPVEPRFPEEAERLWLTGTHTVEVVIDIAPDGRPSRARPLSGPEPDRGFRQAGVEAALASRYEPGTLDGKPVRFFQPLAIGFEGLPEESRGWLRRTLVRVEAIVAGDAAVVLEARGRLDKGEDYAAVAAASGRGGAGRSADWGYVQLESLAEPLRAALEPLSPGAVAGPVAADGAFHLLRKSGELSYGISRAEGEALEYLVVHRCGGLDAAGAARVAESDIADYVAAVRREAYVRDAEALMGQRLRRAVLGRLLVHTDALDTADLEMLETVSDETFRHHHLFWGSITPPRTFGDKVAVYAFARKRDHDQLYRDWTSGRMDGALAALARKSAARPAAAPAWNPAGEYIASSRILAFSCEDLDGHLPVPIAIHELVHMLNFETVYGEGVVPSAWFEEGVATYFAFSRFSRALKLEPGEISASGTLKQGKMRIRYDPRAILQEHQRSVRNSGPVRLAELLGSRPDGPLWNGTPDRAYGASWSLVHFLLHGDEGAHRRAFQDYARLEAEGRGGSEAFAILFGPDLAGLEAAWQAHEREM